MKAIYELLILRADATKQSYDEIIDATGAELDDGVTICVWDGSNAVAELDGEGEVKAGYIYGAL